MGKTIVIAASISFLGAVLVSLASSMAGSMIPNPLEAHAAPAAAR